MITPLSSLCVLLWGLLRMKSSDLQWKLLICDENWKLIKHVVFDGNWRKQICFSALLFQTIPPELPLEVPPNVPQQTPKMLETLSTTSLHHDSLNRIVKVTSSWVLLWKGSSQIKPRQLLWGTRTTLHVCNNWRVPVTVTIHKASQGQALSTCKAL